MPRGADECRWAPTGADGSQQWAGSRGIPLCKAAGSAWLVSVSLSFCLELSEPVKHRTASVLLKQAAKPNFSLVWPRSYYLAIVSCRRTARGLTGLPARQRWCSHPQLAAVGVGRQNTVGESLGTSGGWASVECVGRSQG